MPGAREKRYILEKLKVRKEIAFSLIGDFGKAHRRFKYQRSEQGFLGCVVEEGDPWVYVNKCWDLRDHIDTLLVDPVEWSTSEAGALPYGTRHYHRAPPLCR